MSTKIKLISSESKEFAEVLDSIRKHQKCRNDISQDWITYHIRPDSITDVMMIGSIDTIFGFACLKRGVNYVEIKLLCTEKNNLNYGYDLLLHIVEFCQNLQKQYVLLEALDTAIVFYEKFGFARIQYGYDRFDNTLSDYYFRATQDPMFLDVRNFSEEAFKIKVAEASLKKDYSAVFD